MLKDIFRGYDIRGIYGDDLDENTAYKIGKAFIAFTKVKQVAVGKDMRISSPALFDSLVRGITEMDSDSSAGVWGEAKGATKKTYGVYGNTASIDNISDKGLKFL